MRIPSHPTLIRRSLDARLKKLAAAADSPILAASYSEYAHHCSKKSCRCFHGGPLHPTQHVTYTDEGKNRCVYVPKDLIPQVKAWIARHKLIKKLLHEIHLLSVALIQTHAKHSRRKAGRP